MKATIFARKGKTKKGVEFYSYFTKLTKKDGTEETFTVKIREEDRPKPEDCPVNIIFNKEDANISRKTEENEETGKVYERKELWIDKYELDPEKYRDKSLDDFED